MAILAPNGQDPNNPNGQPNQGGGGTVMNSAGGGGGGNAPGVSGGGGSPSAFNNSSNTASRPAGNPSGQPNVNDYLNANQGAGQQLANGITNNVQNQANQVNNQVNTSNGQLGSQYNSLNNTLGQGQTAANTAFQDPSALLSAYQNAQAASAGGSAYQGPQANSGDLAKYNAYQGDVAGTNQYNQNQQALQNYGTQGQQAYNSAQTQLGNLAQTTSQGANEMGRNSLLQQTVGNPNYNQGQQTLDSLFLQGQGNKLQSNLQGIQNTTANNVNTGNTDYQGKLNALQNLSGSNVDYAKNLFTNGPGTDANAPTGTGLNQIATNVGNEYAAAQAALPAQQAAFANAAKTGNFTSDQLAALGLTAGTQNWGVNAGNYLTPNALTGNAQTATPEEYARYQALSQLSGTGGTLFGSQAAPIAAFSPESFRNTDYTGAISAKQQTIAGTQAGSDLQNALAAMAPGEDVGKGISGIEASIASNPNMTPDQINQRIQALQQAVTNQYKGAASGGGDVDWNAVNSQFTPWTQYYNNVYTPAANSKIGVSGNPLTTPINTTDPNAPNYVPLNSKIRI